MMHPLSETLTRALREELAVLKNTKQTVTLTGGQRITSFAGYTYYRFEITEESIGRDVETVTITLGTSEPLQLKGNVIELENQFLTIALPVDFGAELPQIQCSWNRGEIYETILKTLETQNGNAHLASFLFSPDPATNTYIVPHEPLFPPNLFPEQRATLEKIFRNKITLLWGPIASGKSYTLALAAVAYAAAGKSVLLVTPSNAATDSVFLQTLSVAQKTGVDCINEFIRYDLPSFLTAKEVGPFSFEMEIELRKQEKRAAFKERISLMEKYWRVKRKQILHEDFFHTIQSMRNQLAQLKQQIEELENDLARYSQQLEELSNASLLQRMKVARSKDDAESLQKKITVTKQELKYRTTLQTKLSEEITLRELNTPISLEELKEYRQAVKHIDELGGVDAVQKSIDDFLTINEQMLFLTKRLVCTNIFSVFSNSLVNDRRYDMVLVDDAHCVPLPALYALAALAREKCVIAGDPFEVEAESASASPLAEEWLQRDIFLYLAQTKELHQLFSWSEQNSQWVTHMKSHIAAHPKVSSFMASVLFDDTITSFVSPHIHGRIYFFDTSPLKPQCKQYAGKKRILPYNEAHTRLVVQCVKHALLKDGRTANDIGIILPFNGPTLYTKLQLRLNGMENIEVGTPQEFCGKRKAVIIFDTTMAGVDYTMRAIDDRKVGEHHVVRLLNTVCSCVLEDFYVLANLEHFRSLYKDRLLTRLLLLLQSHADVKDASFDEALQQFDGMDLQRRSELFSFTPDKKKIARSSKPAPQEEEDAELALHMKKIASKKQESTLTTVSSTELATYNAVHRALGYWRDINLLAQFMGNEILFRSSIPSEQALRVLPFEPCENEKAFRALIEKWSLLLYDNSGNGEPSSPLCSPKTPETRVRQDVYKLNAVFNSRTEALIAEGKQKLTADAKRFFQETINKPQPMNPTDWTAAYTSLLARIEAYFSWIEEQLRK